MEALAERAEGEGAEEKEDSPTVGTRQRQKSSSKCKKKQKQLPCDGSSLRDARAARTIAAATPVASATLITCSDSSSSTTSNLLFFSSLPDAWRYVLQHSHSPLARAAVSPQLRRQRRNSGKREVVRQRKRNSVHSLREQQQQRRADVVRNLRLEPRRTGCPAGGSVLAVYRHQEQQL